MPLHEGGWGTIGPTAEPFAGYAAPRAMTTDDVAAVVQAFADATRRASDAGFDVVEIHAAHGYLLHEFLSPLVNTRTDAYGGDFEGRTRIVLETVDAVRAAWGDDRPVLLRVSASDWVEAAGPPPRAPGSRRWRRSAARRPRRRLLRRRGRRRADRDRPRLPGALRPRGARRAVSRSAPSGRSPTRARPRRSSPRAPPTRSCSPVPGCGSRRGRCVPPPSSASRARPRPIRCSTRPARGAPVGRLAE